MYDYVSQLFYAAYREIIVVETLDVPLKIK